QDYVNARGKILSIAGDQGVATPDETVALRDWFTAAELAELTLPGLPCDKRSINRRARDERWHLRSGADGELLARARSGR
ncbi:hypothetical protein, partial [Proteus mirabilis]